LQLRPYAETLAATAAAMRRVASSQGDGVRGTVRVTASESSASKCCRRFWPGCAPPAPS